MQPPTPRKSDAPLAIGMIVAGILVLSPIAVALGAIWWLGGWLWFGGVVSYTVIALVLTVILMKFLDA